MLGLAGARRLRLIGRGAPPTTSEAERAALGERLGNRLFLPVLDHPARPPSSAPCSTLYTPLARRPACSSANRETFILLCLGVLLALAVIFAWLRPPALAPLQEGRRLIDAVGWAAVLPQMLAALGRGVRATPGVGETIGGADR